MIIFENEKSEIIEDMIPGIIFNHISTQYSD